MDFSTLVNDSREAESALGVVFFVAQKAMQEANISSETLDQFQSAFETTLENLDDDDKLMLAYVIDRRISETFSGLGSFQISSYNRRGSHLESCTQG